jgi:acetyl esterase/lipase
MPVLFLCGASIGALLTFNALFPRKPSTLAAFPSFLAGWLTGELALHHIAWQALAVLCFVELGALGGWPGLLGLGLTALSWLGLLASAVQASRAGDIVDAALDADLPAHTEPRLFAELESRLKAPIERSRLLWPFYFGHREVEVIENIAYAQPGGVRNHLDLYRPRRRHAPAPVVLQIHGGAWVVGHKRQQARPLLVDLASRGVICVSANYRLSPRATFPEHLIDVKRALIWIRSHIAEHGGDPSCVIVTGGSAGGHLAALLALTPNRPEYQEGHEDVDTRVQGCIAFYGVYDLAGLSDPLANQPAVSLWQRQVLKKRLEDARDAFEQASPIKHVSALAPPFFVVHGTHDSVVPVSGARSFVAALRQVSHAPVVYPELPYAQHAFDVFHSIRTQHVIRGIHRFLAYVVANRETSSSMREGTRPPARLG